MSVITINNLTKNYKSKVAVNDVSLEIEKGELFGLLGVNGAGKTTLIKVLCGLTKKSAGTVIVDGLNLDKDINKIKEIVDISPQETSVANNLTVKENLEFFSAIYNKDDNSVIDEVVKVFNFNTLHNSPIFQTLYPLNHQKSQA